MIIFCSIISLTISFFILHKINFSNKIYNNYGVVSITGSRAFLAGFVALSHSNHFLYTMNGNKWIFDKDYKIYFGLDNFYSNSGKIGVLIFFMISGFLFYRCIYNPTFNAKEMIKKRVLRIVPMYWFSLLLIITFGLIFLDFKFNLIAFIQSIKWALFIGNYKIGNLSTADINQGVEWTLKIEWLLYLSIVILSISLKKFNNKIKDLFVIVSILLILSIATLMRIYCDFYVDPRPTLGFFTGFIAFRLSDKLSIFKNNNIASIIAIFCFIISFFITSNTFYYIVIFLFSSIFFLIISSGNNLFTFLSNKTIVSLGEVSYSIYLLHGLVLSILVRFIPDGTQLNYFTCIAFSVVFFLSTAFIAKITYLFIEKKFYIKQSEFNKISFLKLFY